MVFRLTGDDTRIYLTNDTGFKCYLSVIVDCFDGKVVSRRLSRNPDATLANSTLVDAIRTLRAGDVPIIHSDCGCHYRWPGWIGICKRHDMARSMSKKACSSDNVACEGFFGRLKNEFLYHRQWKEVTYAEFERKLDNYTLYYNKRRKKKSLGWKSPEEYRTSLGYAA
jgi:putative transposase